MHEEYVKQPITNFEIGAVFQTTLHIAETRFINVTISVY